MFCDTVITRWSTTVRPTDCARRRGCVHSTPSRVRLQQDLFRSLSRARSHVVRALSLRRPRARMEPSASESAPAPLLLSELPEDALCRVMAALQSPRDICRTGACCQALLTATRSDALWECVCCRAFPLEELRRIHLQCFRGRHVADPFSFDQSQCLRAILQCWRADAPVCSTDGAIADWYHIFRALAYWPFPAKVVRFGADTTSLLYIFECPAEPAADSGHAHAGGIYNLFARTSGQTNHIHQGRWRWVPQVRLGTVGQKWGSPRSWQLSPAGSNGGKDKLVVLSDDYTHLTISNSAAGGHPANGQRAGSGVVPFHSNIPPLWRKVVEKDSLVLELGHSKRL